MTLRRGIKNKPQGHLIQDVGTVWYRPTKYKESIHFISFHVPGHGAHCLLQLSQLVSSFLLVGFTNNMPMLARGTENVSPEQLKQNNTLLYFTHNEARLLVYRRFFSRWFLAVRIPCQKGVSTREGIGLAVLERCLLSRSLERSLHTGFYEQPSF